MSQPELPQADDEDQDDGPDMLEANPDTVHLHRMSASHDREENGVPIPGLPGSSLARKNNPFDVPPRNSMHRMPAQAEVTAFPGTTDSPCTPRPAGRGSS